MRSAQGGSSTILVLGGTGKTGRRVTDLLNARGVPVRVASRSSRHRFDWYDESTWAPVLDGAGVAYVAPPVEPEAAPRVAALVRLAHTRGVGRMVLLSGRGVGSPGREAPTYAGTFSIEEAVRGCGAAWTILRPSWFAQNFSEDFLLPEVLAGEVRVPAGDGREPFIDAGDIAAVAVESLLDPRHAGQSYDLSGPRTLTFAEATAEIARATGRRISVVDVPPEDYVAELLSYEVPPSVAQTFGDLFTVIRRGLSDSVSDGVHQVLGRPPRDFADYVNEVAASGAWTPVPVS